MDYLKEIMYHSEQLMRILKKLNRETQPIYEKQKKLKNKKYENFKKNEALH